MNRTHNTNANHMKRSLHYLPLMLVFLAMCILPSCSDEDERPTFPLTVEIFHSVSGMKVAFTGLTHSATSWHWDFGDGNTSTEQNPVHTYEEGGYYIAKLTASDALGQSITKQVRVALALTPEAMLVGDHTAEGYAGKKWRLSTDHEPLGDYFAEAKPTLPPVGGTPVPLPASIFGQLGFGAAYTDEFTFHVDGSYSMDLKEDGAVFGGYAFQLVQNDGDDVINYNDEYMLCIAKYTPDEEATFTFTQGEDITIPSVYGGVTFENAMTLDFSGTSFIGFRDFQRKVIVRSISDTRMQLVVFMAGAEALPGANTHALILTFESVN